MKAVFLDIDGVLNFEACQERVGGIMGVSDDLVSRLETIVKSSGAQIVLTSSWKLFWNEQNARNRDLSAGAKYLFEKLSEHGLHISDRTEERDPAKRGHGIKSWLRKVGEVKSWVVLDDEVFPDYDECGIMPHLVKPDRKTGLTDDLAANAIRILNGE